MDENKTVSAKLANDDLAEFSVFKDIPALLMLHTPVNSCQWEMDNVAIMPNVGGDLIQIGIQDLNGQNYQSWMFKAEYQSELIKFFRELGYPCHMPVNLDD